MKKPLRCVIVDDEFLAQNLMEIYINQTPYLSLVGKFNNAISAIESLSSLQPEIIFLDINMPGMNGIEFLESYTNIHSHIVITTGYPEYALSGYEVNAADFLLKPISYPRFLKAINRIIERDNAITLTNEKQILFGSPSPKFETVSSLNGKDIQDHKTFFMIRVDKKFVKVEVNDIVFVEGMKDYVKIHLLGGFHVSHLTMSKIAASLKRPQFTRINRSYIIQINYIKLIEGNLIEMISGHKLPVGINYQSELKSDLQNWLI